MSTFRPYRKALLYAAVIAAAGSAASYSQSSLANTTQPKDPGVRFGTAGAGQPIAGLTAGELSYFSHDGMKTFAEVDGVLEGLGPRFNLDSCAGCHAYPALGGSSPLLNPQVAQAASMAPGNRVPPFLSLNGPVREVRFVKQPDGTPDGGVHGLFTIAGRPDAPPGCVIAQPDFSNSANLAFRIPTPIFGAGLIEAIRDNTIRQNLLAGAGAYPTLIPGRVNTNGNDGTVTRFGWKAQNKSLALFAAEAYNVEQGVTNEFFPNERDEDSRCATAGTPENDMGFQVGLTDPSDLVAFRAFMRFLDAPAPACQGSDCSPSIQNGHAVFTRVGCASCHTEVLQTGPSATAALNQKSVHLFSDLALHNMGQGLADGITQGAAGPSDFRTAPLWGLGQRIYFLHDGRTTDLLQAILAHQNQGSDASGVTVLFHIQSPSDQQDVLNFLRSL